MTSPLSSSVYKLASDLQNGRLSQCICEIADGAARIILPYWRSGIVAERKPDLSPVTEADRAAEAFILAQLEARWPGVQVVAEERAAAEGLPAGADSWFWLIDPLDGTRGFLQGREAFTVNIALIRDGAPVAGVVAAPATGTAWRTTRPGEGALRRQGNGDWHPVQVRERPAEAIALVSNSLSDEEAARLATRHGCSQWQAMDSSVKLCLVAEGRYDAYPRTGPTSEWDIAAGHAVLAAAGGRIIASDGNPLAYGKAGFLNGAFVAMGV